MAPNQEPQLSYAQLAELAALADGSLDPARRPVVEAWIASSPQLHELYERERGLVELLHQAAASDRAPPRLRARVELQQRQSSPRLRWRVGYAGLAGALAAAALALALVLPAGTPGSPSVSQAALLALRGPSGPGPAPDPSDPRAKLAQRLQGVYFPNWSTTLGWQAIGERHDNLNRRPAVTVYYQLRGRLVAYTIIGAPALAEPSAPITRLNGFQLRALNLDGRTVVTWRRDGHTCVLSATDVPVRMLKQLAAWRAAGVS